MNLIITALYFFLPAYFANMAPVIFGKINALPYPIDSNKKWRNRPIFGKNKTWGGLLYAIVLGTAIFYVQQTLYNIPFFKGISLIDYTSYSLALGFLLASGAILGDLIESLIKRRYNKEPGAEWFPFDQIDYVIGALVFGAAVYLPPLKIIVILFILAPFLHYGANYMAYFLGLKKVRW